MEYFHVFNRGVAKGDIFLDESDFRRFVVTMILSNDERTGLMHIWDNFRRYHPEAKLSDCKQLELHKKKPLVDIVAYCLNKNHFHFLLGNRGVKQNIEKFMQCLGISFVKYFNKKNERVGPLFQGRYKSFHIKDNGRLLYNSAYVNCNSELHSSQKAEEYKWCSFPEYLGKTDFKLCNKEIILSQFKNTDEYKYYALENIREEKESRKFQKELYDD
jgi:putative transposase